MKTSNLPIRDNPLWWYLLPNSELSTQVIEAEKRIESKTLFLSRLPFTETNSLAWEEQKCQKKKRLQMLLGDGQASSNHVEINITAEDERYRVEWKICK